MTIFSFLAAGNFTIRDNGNPNDGIASIFKDGVFVQNFAIPADELVFRASTAGITITFDLAESLGNADLRIDPAPGSGLFPDAIVVRTVRTTGDVTLISAGSITEGGSDAAVDIVAGSLVLSAVTGVGTPGNAIETQTGVLEAETDTGGISLSNVGALVVGGLSADVAGLRVVTSGDIQLVNLGTITLVDETEADSVRGGSSSGDVILTANGYDSDITTTVDQSSILAQGGDIILTAGRDVLFGRTGSNFNNDVRALGDIIVNAGRNFEISGFADFFADGITGLTGGSVIVNAGNNISLLSANGTSAGLRSSGSGGGDIILTTGPGGTFTHQTAGSNAIASFSGDVIVNADRMIIGATSGITAFGQTILRTVSAGREIVLGSLTDAADNALELSDAEIDRIFGDNLVLGGADAGRIRVGAPVSTPGNVDNFTLLSGSDILIQGNLTVSGILSVVAADDVFQQSGTTITATSTTVAGDFGNTDPGFGASVIMNGTIAGANTLSGSGDADTITGTGGANTLDGGAGADTMAGGLGDDNYFVDNLGDIVSEAIGAGNDRVFTSLSYVLTAGSSIETLSTIDSAGTTAINLTGNALANTIIGNAGANVLVGGGGSDYLIGLGGDDTLVGNSDANSTLQGGAGNDWYFIGRTGDSLVEFAGEGDDRIIASVSYTLSFGQEIENISTANAAGTGALDFSGNEFGQIILGNAGANVLNGRGGSDYLVGFGGADTLIGNVDSSSTLQGGTGDDTYFVFRSGDSLVEFTGEGNDRVFTSVSYTLSAGQEIETLSASDQAGTGGIDLTGNEIDQIILGNQGANILSGLGGNDILIGLGGSDILVGGDGEDQLFGGAGSDVLNGGGAADLFLFTEALGASNVDTIQDLVSGLDRIFLENAVFTGLSAGALAAGAFRVGATAQDADDRIIYNAATGALFFDADGNGGGAAVQFATLSGAPALAAGDFVVI